MTALFSEFALSSELLQVVQELGYNKPTEIQAQSLPHLLQGRDLIGQSKTGSGKTAAFGLPVLEKLKLEHKEVQALILCPTRELCAQVARELRKLGRRHFGLQILVVSGGTPVYPQTSALKKGVHCVVGTPGRVLDHLNRQNLDLSKLGMLVLDEADRMLEMGFEKDMERILNAVPRDRQTVLFSATFPKSIQEISRAYQKDPVRVTIQDSKECAPEIRQIVYQGPVEHKFNGLLWLLQQHKPESAIIFCNLKATVIELSRVLLKAQINTACLHGDLDQAERDRVMAKFRNKSNRLLIATDVAARGIDVESLDAVVNFDLPARVDVYVHRIGRTGRAGKRGLALSLATPGEKHKILNIEKFTGLQISQKTLPPIGELNVERFEAAMETLYISGGRKEKVRPGDLLGALTGEAGRLQGSQIGKIEIHDHFSYVAVSKDIARIALQRLRDGRIKGKKFRIEPVR